MGTLRAPLFSRPDTVALGRGHLNYGLFGRCFGPTQKGKKVALDLGASDKLGLALGLHRRDDSSRVRLLPLGAARLTQRAQCIAVGTGATPLSPNVDMLIRAEY